MMIGSTYTFVRQAENKSAWVWAQVTPAFSVTTQAPALGIFVFANTFLANYTDGPPYCNMLTE